MPKFPVDVPIRKVIRVFERLGFSLVRKGNHISMVRENPDGTRTPLTMPNHPKLKSSTLRTIFTQCGISRDDFLKAYEDQLVIQHLARRKLIILDAATELNALRVPPGNRLEALKGDRKGHHSIRINDQWRICFKWKAGDTYDVEITDYHQEAK